MLPWLNTDTSDLSNVALWCLWHVSFGVFFAFSQLPLLLLLLHWFAVAFTALVLMAPLCFVWTSPRHFFFLSHTLYDTLRHAPSLLLAAPLLACLVQLGSHSYHFLLSVARGHFTGDVSTHRVSSSSSAQTFDPSNPAFYRVCCHQLGFTWNGSHFRLQKSFLSVLKFTLCKPEQIPLHLKISCCCKTKASVRFIGVGFPEPAWNTALVDSKSAGSSVGPFPSHQLLSPLLLLRGLSTAVGGSIHRSH